MSQKTTTLLVDDLNGKPAAETVKFSVDRVDLEIDVTATNATKLRSALKPYIAKARLVSGRRPKATKSKVHPLAYSRVVREWALGEGLPVAERGRIADEVIRAYENRGKAKKGRRRQ